MVFGSRSGNGRDRPYRSGNDRPSRSYNSPPVTSRVTSSRYVDREEAPERFAEEYPRGRREENMSSKFFSNFYRERFGSHSPEDYRNLRISQFDRSLSKNDIRVLMEQEFKTMAPFEIKIVRNPEDDERLAYVNFERDNCAKSIRRSMIPRLHRVLGRRLVLDPTGVIRDQEGKYIPDRYNRAVMAADRDRRSPPRHRRRSYSREPPSRSRSRSPSNRPVARSAGKPREANPFSNLVQDDALATRTLFVGNLPGDVRESELRRTFEAYGKIEEVEIKVLSTSVSYAFVLYRAIEGAIEARRSQHNKPLRPGSTRCQIGYGKTQTSNRLYVGGLGGWTTSEMLMDEFDRYGAIEEVEYEPGQTSAYIRFVDIDSACDACSRMKNFELKSGKFITVDFVKGIPAREKPRKRGRSSSSDDLAADSKRQNVDARSWSPTSAGYITTLEDLREHFACTWKGFVTLKKVDYPLGFHRIYGKEHLLQDLLRDESGAALKLNITQRLKLDNNYYQEIIDLPPRELALMIAVDGNPSAERVVQYLRDKGAAGLVPLDECTVNILPQSSTSERLLNFFAPRIAVLKVSPNYMLVVLRKTRKEKAKPQSSSSPAQKVEVKAESSQLLESPPPLPSLRVKSEVDDDKLEQLHQERLQLRAKVKEELRSSPILDPAPAPPDLSLLGRNGDGDNGKMAATEPTRRRSRRDSRSDEDDDDASSSSSASSENVEDNEAEKGLDQSKETEVDRRNL